jgi:hypothetical protein
MTDGPPREWVAYGEASHAVVGVKLGVKIKLATIKPDRSSWGRVEKRKILRKGDLEYNFSAAAMARAETAVLMHLAGQCGPKRIAPDSYRPSRNTPDYDLVDDIIFERLYHLSTAIGTFKTTVLLRGVFFAYGSIADPAIRANKQFPSTDTGSHARTTPLIRPVKAGGSRVNARKVWLVDIWTPQLQGELQFMSLYGGSRRAPAELRSDLRRWARLG